MQLGPAEILVVLVIALVVFGPNKLPEVGRQVGQAYREVRRFQRSLSSEMRDVFADHEDVSDGAAPAPTLPPKRPIESASDSAAGPTSEPTSGPSPPEPPGDAGDDATAP